MSSARTSFGEILRANKGVGPGFDLLRLALALSVLTSHIADQGGTRGFLPSLLEIIRRALVSAAHAGSEVTGAVVPAIEQGIPWMRPIVVTHVPMFFALSGFLVAGSAFRTQRIGSFLGLRLLRIFPALCVEVLLSAVV